MITLVHTGQPAGQIEPQRTDEDESARPVVWTLPPDQRAKVEKYLAEQAKLNRGWLNRIGRTLGQRTK